MRRLREASAPFVMKLPPEVSAPEPKLLGYVALALRNGVVNPVGSVTSSREKAEQDADWWTANDGTAAFVAELREAGR